MIPYRLQIKKLCDELVAWVESSGSPNLLRRPLTLDPLDVPFVLTTSYLLIHPRQFDCSAGVRRDASLYDQLLPVQLPFDGIRPIDRIVGDLCRGQGTSWLRLDESLLPPWLKRRETSYDAMEEVGNGAKGVVVE